jgi:YebC/PmpR family DNA-binding regulatory protein
MAGHSKWSNIKHKKAKEDDKRGRVFTKISHQITIAVKQGGSDENSNPALRLALQKAKEANMPKDKQQNAINKATSSTSKLEEVAYEFYGPSGVACVVNCLTDNKNRTAGEIKAVLNKFNIQLASVGGASYIFTGDTPNFTINLPENQKATLDQILYALDGNEDVVSIFHNAI